MLWVCNWITIIIASYMLFKAISAILSSKYSILHICIIALYMMQILPLGVEFFVGIDENTFANVYYAMTDVTVGILYDVTMLLVMGILLRFAEKYKHYNSINLKESIYDSKYAIVIRLILWIGMFSPLAAIIVSPQPSAYLQFAYSYRNLVTAAFKEYHTSVMSYCCTIAFFCTMLQYSLKKHTKLIYNLDIVLAISIFTWTNQKRTLFTFALLGILVIDIVKKNYSHRKKSFICKVLLLLAVNVMFFYIYSLVTGKGVDSEFNTQYYMYYSRMNVVKTAIYDVLNGSNIVQYPGQTLLRNLLFFVPRGIWPSKPAMFVKYFSAYAIGRENTDFIDWNFQVNIWTEFISNLGIWGIIVAILFVVFVARKSEKSNNVIIYLLGTVVLVVYFLYGFEGILHYCWIFWCFAIVFSKLFKRKKKQV